MSDVMCLWLIRLSEAVSAQCVCVCELLGRSAVCVWSLFISFLDLSETLNGICSVRVEQKPGKSEIFTVDWLQDNKGLFCIEFAA